MFDYPIFEMPLLGHRMLFAFDAIVHVLVSHGAAVGGSIIVVLLEWLAIKRNDPKLDELAYRLLFVFFVVATSVGALTGIGIWIHANIIDPPAIGTLLRVFFWKWFVEWIVFNIELVFLLIWFLTWKTWREGARKRLHFRMGFIYAVSSWLTMAIITAILGFMMTPGEWLSQEFPPKPDYLAALMNPSWIPSLAFRTFAAIGWAATIAIMYTLLFTQKDPETRTKGVRILGTVMFAAAPLVLVSAWWYYLQFPQAARDLFIIAGVTRQFMGQPELLYGSVAIACAVILLLGAYLYAMPRRAPVIIGSIMALASIFLVSEFERIREFTRKPYIIYGYMYANGVRKTDVGYLNKEGVLKFATFVPAEYRTITPANKIEAGHYLFQLECRFCHTADGINSIKSRIKGMNEQAIYHRIGSLNSPSTPFMPPFVGTDEERGALAAYLATLNSGSF
jgi:mono/diheme cytochrome c family protein